MADYNNADYAVQLPNQFPSPGQALQDLISSKERDLEKRNALLERQREQSAALEEKRREYDEKEKERKRNQADAYAKYVGEETKVSPSLITGAGKQAVNVTQQLSKASGKLLGLVNADTSIADLQSVISSEVRPMFASLSILGEENKKRDAIIKEAKTLYPGIDADKLANDFDEDVSKRYFDKNGNILPPQTITPSPFQQNITDPDFLSKYLTPTATGGLETSAKHPKGKEIPILAGTRDEHTTFKTNVPDWANINVTPEEIQKGGGLMPSGFVPKLSVKGHEVPMPQLSEKYGKQNKPFMVAEDDAYQSLIGSDPTHATQLAAIARREYPSGKGIIGFDEMNPTEKDLLKKHIAYNLMQSGIDANPAYATSITKTPKQNINIAAQNAPAPIDIYTPLLDLSKKMKTGTVPLNALDLDVQNAVLNKVKNAIDIKDADASDIVVVNKDDVIHIHKVLKRTEDGKDVKPMQQNGKNILDDNGNIIYTIDGKNPVKVVDWVGRDLGTVTKTGINLTQAKTQKERAAVRASEKENNKPAETGTITVVLPDGRQGEIPKNSLSQFLKENPKAKTIK